MNIENRLEIQHQFAVGFRKVFPPVFFYECREFGFDLFQVCVWIQLNIGDKIIPSPSIILPILFCLKEIVDGKQKIKSEMGILWYLFNDSCYFIITIGPSSRYLEHLADGIFAAKIFQRGLPRKHDSVGLVEGRAQVTLGGPVSKHVEKR